MMTLRQALQRQETIEAAAPKEARIALLKSQLAAGDYKILKCSEYSLAGLDAPYDIAGLHAERKAIRDEINALEAEIQALEDSRT